MPDSKRFAQVIRVRPECVEEYIKIHNPIPDQISACIKSCHISDYSIFYEASLGLLLATFKYSGSDFESDMARMRADQGTRAWWKVTDAMQVSLNEESRGSEDTQRPWWTACREVFRLD